MQMAKTSAALGRLARSACPTSSCWRIRRRGVTASFDSAGRSDPRRAEGADRLRGARVIQETIRQPLPEGFQRAEFLLEHGMVDRVVERKDLRDLLRSLLAFFAEPAEPPVP